jgi:hypothetical protein
MTEYTVMFNIHNPFLDNPVLDKSILDKSALGEKVDMFYSIMRRLRMLSVQYDSVYYTVPIRIDLRLESEYPTPQLEISVNRGLRARRNFK